jgi:hypothetical protein
VSLERTHSLVEVGIGALSVPAQQFCIPTQGCSQGDLTLLGSLKYLVRWKGRFAAGAGVSLGFKPLSDDASISTPNGSIERTHSRNYFILGGLARYYPVTTPQYNVWVGGSGGLVIVADIYDIKDKGTAFINPHSTTVPTQGAMVGVALGGDWLVGNNFSVGAWTHEMLWLLPDVKACAATQGDCATVEGKRFSLELGVSLTYRTGIF